jgi:hypothetical protein
MQNDKQGPSADYHNQTFDALKKGLYTSTSTGFLLLRRPVNCQGEDSSQEIEDYQVEPYAMAHDGFCFAQR